jgi:hypothetical protein
VALGSFRNELYGVQEAVHQGGAMAGGPAANVLFWAYLYVLGPYMVTFGSELTDTGAVVVSDYWNSIPDWARLIGLGLPVELALAIFYPLIAACVIFLTRSKLYEARILGALAHVMCFVTFFSRTLVATPVVGSLLILAFIRRAQQAASPPPAYASSRTEPASSGLLRGRGGSG